MAPLTPRRFSIGLIDHSSHQLVIVCFNLNPTKGSIMSRFALKSNQIKLETNLIREQIVDYFLGVDLYFSKATFQKKNFFKKQ